MRKIVICIKLLIVGAKENNIKLYANSQYISMISFASIHFLCSLQVCCHEKLYLNISVWI